MRSSLLLTVVFCFGCGTSAVPEPPQPAAAPAAGVARATRWPRDHDCRCFRLCIVLDGEVKEADAIYRVATGDTLTMDSLPFSSLAPLTSDYAVVAGWYIDGSPISFRGRRYRKYAESRILGINEITRMGEYRGVGVYVEAERPESASDVVYLPTRPGCEFQPYRSVGTQPARGR